MTQTKLVITTNQGSVPKKSKSTKLIARFYDYGIKKIILTIPFCTRSELTTPFNTSQRGFLTHRFKDYIFIIRML